MTITFIGNRRLVARVYDPDADIEYLFTTIGDAKNMHRVLTKYNANPPILIEEEN